MRTCSSGKRVYDSAIQAEQALVHLQAERRFKDGEGPVAIYQCDLCTGFHLTSKGPANPFLAGQLRDGTINRQREANNWIKKLDRK